MRLFGLLILMVIGEAQPLLAQNWELRKNEDGIRVYTRPVKGSSFDAFKAEMVLETSVDELVSIIRNIDKHAHIFPDTKEITILDRPTDSTHIHYSVTNAPWPVDDRDAILILEFKRNPKTGVVVITSSALPNYLPEKEDMVRIVKSTNAWTFIPEGAGKVRIIYEVQAEPGGSIPDWLANSAAVDIPFETFVNLRNELSD